LPLFESTLQYVRDHGTLPPDTVSKEDQNAVGESGVSDEELLRWREDVVKGWFSKAVQESWETEHHKAKVADERAKLRRREREIRICILDGFLLYPPPPQSSADAPSSSDAATLHRLAHALLRPRLFLPSTKAQTLTRRAARTGYVTLEGFWTDPPGYVEDVVWPNYARDHAWMYVDGLVDRGADGAGVFDEKAVKSEGVDVCPGQGTWDMHRLLEWGVERVRGAVEEQVKI